MRLPRRRVGEVGSEYSASVNISEELAEVEQTMEGHLRSIEDDEESEEEERDACRVHRRPSARDGEEGMLRAVDIVVYLEMRRRKKFEI